MSKQEEFKDGISESEADAFGQAESESWHAIRQRWLEGLLNGTASSTFCVSLVYRYYFYCCLFASRCSNNRKTILK